MMIDSSFHQSSARRAGAAIRFNGISKKYGIHTAIDRLDLDVNAGEFISLLGPSGSGKSTLLMMLAGFESVSEGNIQLDGRDVTHRAPERRGIGMVFQNYALFPHMTVAQNVGFALRQQRRPGAEIAERVKKALDLVQLETFGERYPQQLSGGQQQRVAIARAVIFDPPVLLMDEPLSALDKKLREAMQLEIKSLHDRLGITFIYVTHDQREALVMSDRVALLNGGRIEQIGPPAALYDEPANSFVASFISEANFLPIAVISGREQDAYDVSMLGGSYSARGSVTNATRAILRPEKIWLTGENSQASTAEPLKATAGGIVTSAIFMGESIRYTIEAAGEVLVVIEPHRADLPAHSTGSQVRMHWTPADLRLVP
jgi:spermidine/putrescine ABC transporter ATP-binding subunit